MVIGQKLKQLESRKNDHWIEAKTTRVKKE